MNYFLEKGFNKILGYSPLRLERELGVKITDKSESSLASFGLYPYSVLEKPDFEPLTHRCLQDENLNYTNGSWVQGWVITELSALEKEKALLEAKEGLLEQTSNKRKEVQWGGTIFNGIAIKTEPDNVLEMQSAVSTLQAEDYPIDFATENGVSVSLDQAGLQALVRHVVVRGQQCRSRAAKLAAIVTAANTPEEYRQAEATIEAEIDNGWPS